MFNPARLTVARLRRKFSKKALAEALGFEEKTIRRFENEAFVPPPETLAAIARVLDFPEEFFFGHDMDELPIDAASFRSLKAMLARERNAALAAGSIAFLFDDWISKQFGLPEPDLPDLKEDITPESAAKLVRQMWSLGDRPIKNMVHQLEAKGVRVFSLCENTKSVDAFSVWRRSVPYVFLNTFKTAERSRYDAAHELGHLVLHKHGGPSGGGNDAELQANNFASAFLMPRADVLAKIPRVTSLNQIVQAKNIWHVSVAALNYRLHKLEITTDWQYRTFSIQISQNYGQEPNSIRRETSIVLDSILSDLRSRGFNKHKIAEELSIPVKEIENIVFGLSNMQSIEGGEVHSVKGRAKLRLI
jgi:Zn-dependent peptidase ImmA (M78 family)/DNA-binding XRE family transcriptional regulator